MDSVRTWLLWIEALPSSTALRESTYLYAVVLSGHVVGMCVFAGLVLMMDLRLVGIGNLGTSFSLIERRLFPWQVAGMVISATTGLILVYQQPTRFYTNVFFWLKVMMMVLAAVNVLVFYRTIHRSVSGWDAARRPPAAAILAGVVSVLLWVMVILVGRLMGYNWFNLQ